MIYNLLGFDPNPDPNRNYIFTPIQPKISQKLIGFFRFSFHQSTHLTESFPMIPISHMVMSGQHPVN